MTGAVAASEASYALGFSSSTSDPGASRLPAAVAQASRKLGASAAHLVDRKKSRIRKMRRGVQTAARLTSSLLRKGGFRYHAAMVTLTYAPGQTWHGRQISGFLHAVRQWHKRIGKTMHYVWVAEMQQRGAVHYHVIFWLPSGYRIPKPDKKGWWPYGGSDVKGCGDGVGYATKYASKGEEGPQFPKGVRIHGSGGLDLEGKVEMRYWRAPSEAREFFGFGADIRPVTGGRVCSRTGLFWRSPWRLVSICGIQHMLRIEVVTP